MALRVKISARAAAHNIRKAADCWAENRPAAPGAVRIDLGDVPALLAEQPGIGTAYAGVRTQGVRRLLMGRIRYFVYYRATRDTLEILAVWHESRGKQPSL